MPSAKSGELQNWSMVDMPNELSSSSDLPNDHVCPPVIRCTLVSPPSPSAVPIGNVNRSSTSAFMWLYLPQS